VAERIEFEMSPEELLSHGSLKAELIRVLSQTIKDAGLDRLFTDGTRVSCSTVDLSVEPDVVFMSWEASPIGESIESKPAAQPSRFIELDGDQDWVTEIMSDSSVTKDI